MLTNVLRTIASSLQAPVIVILIILVVVIIIILGMLIAEIFTERRKFKSCIPKLVDELQQGDDPVLAIRMSGLLKRQIDALLELTRHSEIDDESRESLAVNLVFNEQAHFDNRIKVTDLIAKIAPMLGLMGTLIPLGPGLLSLGAGETETLSESLLIAFDTTILGLITAAVALLISTIRKSWYSRYMAAFESATECVLEIAKNHRVFNSAYRLSGKRKRSDRRKNSNERENNKLIKEIRDFSELEGPFDDDYDEDIGGLGRNKKNYKKKNNAPTNKTDSSFDGSNYFFEGQNISIGSASYTLGETEGTLGSDSSGEGE